jgi:cyclic beta-1,2-glucan synthetase
MFGVPELALKRDSGDNLVIAPYASFLALMIAPRDAWKNLRRLKQEGVANGYGFYEAIDYTPSRRPKGQAAGIVRSFMAHHQGMSLVALDNVLNNNVMRRRFSAEPAIKAAELLLQERVPRHAPLLDAHPHERLVELATVETTAPTIRPYTTPDTPAPRTHLLSNGLYTTVVTNAGGGYSAYKNLLVTRWRQDTTRDAWGSFCYINDVASGQFWSTGYQPTRRRAEVYEVDYAPDRAELLRRDDGIETRTQIIVSPEDHVEIRRVGLTNRSLRTRHLELTSYAEVVLDTLAADSAHPAFGKLFIESEFLAPQQALVFTRRRRAATDESRCAMHLVALETKIERALEYETDRAKFLGRAGMLASPDALHRPLTNTMGAVLDPIMSLRARVQVPPGETVRVSFVTGFANTREELIGLCDKYCDARTVERTFDLAQAHSQVLLRHLGVTAEEAHLFQRVASRVIYPDPALRAPAEILARNVKGQRALYGYGISGDYPIVLVRVDTAEELELVRQMLLAHEFWRMNNFSVDLVILNEHAVTYTDELQGQIQAMIDTSLSHPWLDKPGGVFLRRGDHIPDADKILLQTVARVVLNGDLGGIANQLERTVRTGGTQTPERALQGTRAKRILNSSPTPTLPPRNFDNGLGGFSSDGREYIIRLEKNQTTPAPWINVLANENFGCLVSESGLGFTWGENSQQNRLTPWSNDPVLDTPGEAIYLRDERTGEVWSPTLLPASEDQPYIIRHGAGYSIFEHTSHDLSQELLVFVAKRDPLKVLRLKLRNLSRETRAVMVTSYAEWVLGTTREQAQHFIITERDEETGAVFARNTFNTDFNDRIAFAAISAQVRGMTADRAAFIGRNGSLAQPLGVVSDLPARSNVGASLDPCAALQTRLELASGQEKELVFVLGQAKDRARARELVRAYRDAAKVQSALDEVRSHWDELLGTIQVKTPDASMDVLLNRWLLYQTLVCRVWGRSAFYQSGGAYGFRDQLQDVMAMVYTEPQITRAHILRAAAHQFAEGDVMHWWHEPSGAGVRTRISDDYLWLPFVTQFYLDVTGDAASLDEQVPFLHAPPLEPEQHDSYIQSAQVGESASLYEHCVRALDHSLAFGEHGLPLMGMGDWNDGMNSVGDEGKGESVWLGWFLYMNLIQFARTVEKRGDATRAANYRAQAEKLKRALEEHGWDGEWYRRAYFDDGTPLGSAQNDECKIDSIAQTWAVISDAAPPERRRAALDAVEKYLVREREGLVLLLTPPFDQLSEDPGYIKGYVPGIRENGGQYTHAALWVVLAFALQGDGDRANALYQMLNPIHHTRTAEDVTRYKVEPYVVAADVSSHPQQLGRGGWTWYTGSAGWMYRVAIESILGFKKRGAAFTIDPCIPRGWERFEMTFRFGSTRYEILVENPHSVNHGVGQVEVDGSAQPTREIQLSDDGQIHRVRVVLAAV